MQVWGVIPALHTPLMSVSNAISGVVILGGMLEVTGGVHAASLLIGAVAAGVAAINCGGTNFRHCQLTNAESVHHHIIAIHINDIILHVYVTMEMASKQAPYVHRHHT